MAEAKSGKKWLRYGCFGCLGVVGVLVLATVAVMGIAWMGARSEQVTAPMLSPAIPPAEVVPPTAVPPDAETGTDAVAVASTTPTGRVTLDLRGGEFHVLPAAAGEALTVEASYDERTYELTERFHEGVGGAPWDYTVTFRQHGSTVMAVLRQILGGTQPKVEVRLPADQPLSLTLRLGEGGAVVDFGGLWLVDTEVVAERSGVMLRVPDPLVEPSRSFAFRGSMGGFQLDRLGNLSPARAEIECGMGGMDLDLRGTWRSDAAISLHVSRGGTTVRLPRDVNVLGTSAGVVLPGGEPETGRPTLTVSVSGDEDSVQFRD